MKRTHKLFSILTATACISTGLPVLCSLSSCNDPIPTGIEILGANAIKTGSTSQYAVKFAPSGTYAECTWFIEQGDAFASIDENGTLTATAAGNVTIKAVVKNHEDVSATKDISIVPTVPLVMTIDGPDKLYFLNSTPKQYTATVLPLGSPSDVTWEVIEGAKYIDKLASKIAEGKIALTNAGESVEEMKKPVDIVLMAKLKADETIVATKTIKGYWSPTDIDIIGDDVIYAYHDPDGEDDDPTLATFADYGVYNHVYPGIECIDLSEIEWTKVSGSEKVTINEKGQLFVQSGWTGEEQVTIKATSVCDDGKSTKPSNTKTISIVEAPTSITINPCKNYMIVGEKQILSVSAEQETATTKVTWSIATPRGTDFLWINEKTGELEAKKAIPEDDPLYIYGITIRASSVTDPEGTYATVQIWVDPQKY